MFPFVVSFIRPSICGQRLQDSHVLRAPPANTSKGARCFCNYRPCERSLVMGGVMSPSLQNRAIIVQVAGSQVQKIENLAGGVQKVHGGQLR